MDSKSVKWRGQASNDLQSAISWCRETTDTIVARRFLVHVDELDLSIRQFPYLGSLRYADTLGIPNLRFRAVGEFPYLEFYIEHEHHVDIWRLLHIDSDLPNHLR